MNMLCNHARRHPGSGKTRAENTHFNQKYSALLQLFLLQSLAFHPFALLPKVTGKTMKDR
jgi:hypothetical protein